MPFTCIDWRINKYISISSLPITLNFFDESIHLNEPIHFLIQLLIRTEVPQKNICLGSRTSRAGPGKYHSKYWLGGTKKRS